MVRFRVRGVIQFRVTGLGFRVRGFWVLGWSFGFRSKTLGFCFKAFGPLYGTIGALQNQNKAPSMASRS